MLFRSKPEQVGGFLVGHGLGFRHNALKDCAPDDKAVAARPAFLLGQLLPQHLFPVFKLPDFLLSVLNLGLQFLAGFLSWLCRGWSLLSAPGHRKGQSIFSAALSYDIRLIFQRCLVQYCYLECGVFRIKINCNASITLVQII